MLPASRSVPLRSALLLCFLVAAAGLLHADEFWKTKPRSEWTLKQAMKLLEDSPWARQEVRVVARPLSGADILVDRSRAHCDPDATNSGGDCLQTRVQAATDSSRSSQFDFSSGSDIVFLIRWESSAPVEDAFVRLAELGERATAHYLSMPPRLPADRYVVTLKALQKAVAIGASPGSMPLDPYGPLENDAKGPRARLAVGNVSVAPVESERSGVGASDAVHFYFPRRVEGSPLIPPDRASRVTFEFRGQRFSLKTHFSLTPGMLR
jgi:hypothetical protein